MANPRYSDAAQPRGGKCEEAVGTNQKGPGKIGAQAKHGGASDGPEKFPTNAENSAKKGCGFGEAKTPKGKGGAATRGF